MPVYFSKKLANLQFAISLLIAIGFIIALGTIIEQDQSLNFYKENYSEFAKELSTLAPLNKLQSISPKKQSKSNTWSIILI